MLLCLRATGNETMSAVLEKLGISKARVMDILVPRPALLKDLGLTRTAIARHVVRIEPPLPDMQKHALLNRLRGLRADGRPFMTKTRGIRL